MDSEFVCPSVDRLPLSGVNRWIDVKHELNTGEQRALMAAMVQNQPMGQAPILDTKEAQFAQVVAFVVGWSFTDQGKPVPLNPAAVDNLKPSTFQEIFQAIDAHAKQVDEEQRARKNGQATASASSPISLSPEPLVGVTSGC